MSNSIKETYENIKLNNADKEQMLDAIWLERDGHLKKQAMRDNKLAFINAHKVAAAAIAAVIIVGAASGTAYAINKYLTGGQVVEELGANYANSLEENKKVEEIAQMFDKKESEIQVQKIGDYTVIYMGNVVADKVANDEIKSEMNNKATYAVVAIEKDGGFDENFYASCENGMKETFVASPFIQGYRPIDINIFSLNSSSTFKIIDGVYYSLFEYGEDLEVFADRKLYVGVFEMTQGADMFGYNYDSESGLITRNTHIDALNALFEMDIDSSKADAKKADEIVSRILNEVGNDMNNEIDDTADNFVYPTTEELESLIEKSDVVVLNDELVKDENGNYRYGTDGRSHSVYTDYILANYVDYQWDYVIESKELYIYKMYNEGETFYQDVYKYGDDPMELQWVKQYNEVVNRQ